MNKVVGIFILELLLLYQTTLVYLLMCSDVRESPAESKITVAGLQTMPPKEISLCLAHLGKESLGPEESKYIWNALIHDYEGVENIPEEQLIQLQWVTAALSPEDIANITIDSVDIIENFGKDYNLSPDLLKAIAEKVKEDWGGKEPEHFSGYDLKALQRIICYFNRSEIERIHPKAYKEAASQLGKLKDCNMEVLQGLATLAMNPDAFGPARNWSDVTFSMIGTVAEGLPPEYVSQQYSKNTTTKPINQATEGTKTINKGVKRDNN